MVNFHSIIFSLGSWIWRKLLKLRDEVYGFLRIDIRDGQTCNFWFNNWTEKGRLIDITGATGTTYLGVLRHARVCDAVNLEGWTIRGQRCRWFQELYRNIFAITPPKPENCADIVKRDKVAWSRVVWLPQGVPRYAFITWLAIRNRLSTWDRMRQCGIVQGCVFCGERDETRHHLYFACPYSYTGWEVLARRLVGNGINPDW
ncbi:hypothetical protein IGI04_025866 [Brassica rapa subsp. trilocularis]|uniref:Reverse transcriptase zinc-binding domain-containing protein n=1 Tax=Brassica rapa subsp. trilocularis TaxID=1813537 RepID=A0ABQ7KUC2_BRACM|nr:hypothetical protein IGI04_025866 [Brassica rapa subsp. trilocularis]